MNNQILQIFFSVIISFFLLSCRPPLIQKGEMLIVNGGDNTLQRVDLNTFTISKQFSIHTDTGYYAHHLSLSPQKNYLSIAFPAYNFIDGHEGLHTLDRPGRVLVISRKNFKKQYWINTPRANYNAIMNPQEDEVWTAAYSHSGKVYVYGFPEGNIKTQITVDPDPSQLIFCNDNKYVAVACGESSFVTFINVQNFEKVKEVKVDPYPGNIEKGFENKVFVLNRQQKSLNLIDLDKLKAVDFIDFGYIPSSAKYNPVTNEIWVSSENTNSLFVYKKDKQWKLSREIKLPAAIYTFEFLDNYTQLAGIGQTTNQLIILDTSSDEILKVVQTGKNPNGLVIWE